MDNNFFEIINNFVGQYSWLDLLGVLFSGYAGYVLVGGALIYLAVQYSRKNLSLIWWSFVSAIAARFVLVDLIRFFYNRPRPFEVLDIIQLVRHSSGHSFPSGHAAFYFALSAGIYFANKKIGIVFFAVSTLIGTARVYAGLHWPSDILAGAAIGIAAAVAIRRYSK